MNHVPGPLPPGSAADRVAATSDQETVYFEGSPLLRGELGRTTLCILGGVGLAASPSLLWIFDVREAQVPWVWPIAIVLGAIVFCVPILRVKRIKYRISNYRIDREIGLISKRIDTLELWHVEDIQFNQSMLDRVLGVGTIRVFTRDETTRMLDLMSLPNPRQIFDSLKSRIIAVKRQRGVIKLDGGAISARD